MWSLLASAVLLLWQDARVDAQSCGAGGMTQTGTNNYVVDVFTGSLLFTYAIDQCTAVSLVDSTVYVKYTCTQDEDDKWWLTKISYVTETCQGTGTDVETWSEDTVTTPGEQGYFQCDGNNNYAEVSMSIDSSCAVPMIVFAGLGNCAVNSNGYDTKFYCDATQVLMQLYLSTTATNITTTMCDDTQLYCASLEFTATCSLSGQLLGTNIYGQMIECATNEGTNINSPTLSPTPSPSTSSPTTAPSTTSHPTSISTTTQSSTSGHCVLLSLIVALFANLWH